MDPCFKFSEEMIESFEKFIDENMKPKLETIVRESSIVSLYTKQCGSKDVDKFIEYFNDTRVSLIVEKEKYFKHWCITSLDSNEETTNNTSRELNHNEKASDPKLKQTQLEIDFEFQTRRIELEHERELELKKLDLDLSLKMNQLKLKMLRQLDIETKRRIEIEQLKIEHEINTKRLEVEYASKLKSNRLDLDYAFKLKISSLQN